MSDWRTPIGYEAVCRRANGRRKYHSLRRFQARLRQIAIARRLIELGSEAWARGGIPDWMPRGIKTQLAEEFGVCWDTMWRDVRAIERWEIPPPVPQDPRFRWAQERTRMDKRITVRLPDDVFQRLSDAVKAQGTDVSDIIRQALLVHLREGLPVGKDQVEDHTCDRMA